MLKFMRCTRQVIHHVALQQSELLCTKFMAGVYVYDTTMLTWLDESGCDQQNSTRRQAYSIHGIRLVDHKILIRRVRYSAILIILVKGIHDVFLDEGNLNWDRFEKSICCQC